MPLPWIKVWTIFEVNDWGEMIDNDYLYLEYENKYCVFWGFAKEHPDFFEPVNERETIYPSNLMNWYTVGVSLYDWIVSTPPYKDVMKSNYILWLRFPTEKTAKAYIDLKIDVARFNMTWWETYFNEFYINNEDWIYREEVYIWKSTYDKINVDFILPLDATDEEKENRVKLLKAYYWF